MTRKLPDEEAACNMIKRMRANHALSVTKSITVRIGKDDDSRSISAVLKLSVYAPTGSVSVRHSLYYRRKSISPSSYEKLVCSNAHAIEQLEKQRAYNRKSSKTQKAK